MIPVTTGDMMHVHGGFGAGVEYTVRLSIRLRERVEPELLREALDKTQRRFPFLCVRLRKGADAFYYEENPLPVALIEGDAPVCLNAEQTNFHLWAVCWREDFVHLDFYHGLSDGTGIYRVLSALLRTYYALKGELTDEPVREEIPPEWTADPQDTLPPPDPAAPATGLAPAFTPETDGGLTPAEPTVWDIELDEAELMRAVAVNDATPGTLVSLLLARAIDALYPRREKEIVSAYVINARPMLHAEPTFHNCLTTAVFPYSAAVRAMPVRMQGTVYRGMTFVQSEEEHVAAAVAQSAEAIRAAAASAPGVEDKKRVFKDFFLGGEGRITFLVSYVGKWKDAELGGRIREFWTHAPNSFAMIAELAAAGGKVFVSLQQRFKEDCVREAFLAELEELRVSCTVRRRMALDVPAIPEPQE